MVDTKVTTLNLIDSQKDQEGNLPFQINSKNQKRISIFKAYKTFCTKKLFFCLIFAILGSIGGGITAQLLEYFTGELISKLNDNSSNKDIIMHNVKKNLCYLFINCFFFIFMWLSSNMFIYLCF